MQNDGKIIDLGLSVPLLGFTVRAGNATLTNANEALGTLLGRPTQDFLASPDLLWDHVLEADRERLDGWFASPVQGHRLLVRIADVDGKIIVTEITLGLHGDQVTVGPVQVDALVHPVLDRAMRDVALAKLQASDDAFAATAGHARFHLRLWPRLGVVWANEGAAKELGIDLEDLLHQPNALFDAVSRDQLPTLERAMQEAVGGQVTVGLTIERAGSTRDIRLVMQPRHGGMHDAVMLEVGVRGGVQDLPLQIAEVTESPVMAARPKAESTPIMMGGADPIDVSMQMAAETSPSCPAQPPTSTASALSPASPAADTATTRTRDRSVERRDVGNLVASLVGASDVGSRRLTYEGEMAVLQVDAAAVERALACALENVRRHTPPQTKVHVTVARAMSGVLVTIRDDGPGFAWADPSIPGRHGMAAVKDLIASGGAGMRELHAVAERHDGSVTVQSTQGIGTTVRLLLHGAATMKPATDAATTVAGRQAVPA